MTLLYDREREILSPEALALLAGVDPETLHGLVPAGEQPNPAHLPEFLVKRINRTVDEIDPLRQLDIYSAVDILAAHKRGELA